MSQVPDAAVISIIEEPSRTETSVGNGEPEKPLESQPTSSPELTSISQNEQAEVIQEPISTTLSNTTP